MANEQNLRPPFDQNSPKIARENQKKSVAARKRNKKKKETLSAVLDKVLSQTVTDEKQLEIIKKSGVPMPKKPTYRDFLVSSVVLKSVKRGRVEDLAKMIEILGESSNANIQDATDIDTLSQSLMELAEELESDD